MPIMAPLLNRQPVSADGVSVPGLAAGDLVNISFFEYVSAPFVFAGNENQQQNIQIQYDSHFICVMSMFDTTAQTGGNFGTGVANGGSLVQITDGKGPWQLSNGLVPTGSLFGTAQRPYVWPWTHTFVANSFIGISLTGSTGAGQTVRLVFGGYKVPPALYTRTMRALGIGA